MKQLHASFESLLGHFGAQTLVLVGLCSSFHPTISDAQKELESYAINKNSGALRDQYFESRRRRRISFYLLESMVSNAIASDRCMSRRLVIKALDAVLLHHPTDVYPVVNRGAVAALRDLIIGLFEQWPRAAVEIHDSQVDGNVFITGISDKLARAGIAKATDIGGLRAKMLRVVPTEPGDFSIRNSHLSRLVLGRDHNLATLEVSGYPGNVVISNCTMS